MKKTPYCLLVLVAALLPCHLVFAQVDTGALLGTVKDPSGAVVPGAKVSMTNEGTGLSLSTLAGQDGSYIFRPVRIGSYTVEAEFQGFQKAIDKNVSIEVCSRCGQFHLAAGPRHSDR